MFSQDNDIRVPFELVDPGFSPIGGIRGPGKMGAAVEAHLGRHGQSARITDFREQVTVLATRLAGGGATGVGLEHHVSAFGAKGPRMVLWLDADGHPLEAVGDLAGL